jgi:periplasmic divalent cation tolerance protein
MSDAVIVFSTCANRKEAQRIARKVVEESLAACVQLLPPMQSIYRWQGAIEQSKEVLMLFKTTLTNFSKLEQRITELHSYDTPEIIAIPAVAGAEKYLTWLRDAVQNAG